MWRYLCLDKYADNNLGKQRTTLQSSLQCSQWRDLKAVANDHEVNTQFNDAGKTRVEQHTYGFGYFLQNRFDARHGRANESNCAGSHC